MRKSTIGSILIFLIFVPTYFFKPIVTFLGYADTRSGTAQPVVALLAVIFAVAVVSIIMLLNPRILAWRKARGRDIEDEERYESSYGMVKLTPNDDDPDEINK